MVAPMVRKAVIPAAGLGTRFLPATKAQPKEMLPLVDKPAIQYVVEEAVRAGIRDILIITGRGKRSLEDHFDRSFELEFYLEKAGREQRRGGHAGDRRARRHPLRAPGRAEGPRARGRGRTRPHRRRALRGPPGRRPHGRDLARARGHGRGERAHGRVGHRTQGVPRVPRSRRTAASRPTPSATLTSSCASVVSSRSPLRKTRLRTSRSWVATCSRLRSSTASSGWHPGEAERSS